MTGGLAMTLGVAAGGLVAIRTASPELTYLLLGMALLLAVGLLDDLRDLRWWVRILAQMVAALGLFYGGGVRVEQLGGVFGFPELTLGPLSLPLTVIATVGLINAINLVDGVDGLAGSLLLVSLAREPRLAELSVMQLLALSTLDGEKRDALQQGELF